MVGIPLLFHEREIIEQLLSANWSCSDIARALERAKNTILVEVRVNGGKKNYSASLAQKRSEDVQDKKKQKIRTTFAMKFAMQIDSSLGTRLETLEQHISILYDIIEEMKRGTSND